MLTVLVGVTCPPVAREAEDRIEPAKISARFEEPGKRVSRKAGCSPQGEAMLI
jgi:hypothetical protein